MEPTTLPTDNPTEQDIVIETPEKPKSSKKLIIILASIFSVFILIALAILIAQNSQLKKQLAQPSTPTTQQTTESTQPTQPTDPTAGWKTYTNEKYNYQIKYPNNMIIQEAKPNILKLSKRGPTQKKDTEFYDGISLRFQPLELANINLESYVQEEIQKFKTEGISEILSGPNQISIGNYAGLTYTARGLGTHKYIYIQSSNKIMIMEIIDSTNDPTNQGFQQTVDQILSTFKFLE